MMEGTALNSVEVWFLAGDLPVCKEEPVRQI